MDTQFQATEKQVTYIHSLLDGMEIENIPYLRQQMEKLASLDTSTADGKRAVKYVSANIKDWMGGCLYPTETKRLLLDGKSVEDVVESYTARIAAIRESVSSGLSKSEASAWINAIKNNALYQID